MAEAREIDVLVLGGGINGCGTFRDLSAQGIDCLLLERTDFCAGASAASSRLMHGGLKYLETGEFRLVRESAEERNRLLENAPHYVTALPVVLPVRSRFGGIVPSVLRFLGIDAALDDRGSIITRLGLTLYDLYGRRRRTMPNHRMLSRAALDRTVAGLDAGIVGAALYHEGRISHAERLGLELVLDAEALNPGSRALNHVGLEGEDAGTVAYRHGGAVHRVRPKVIVNAGGAWIDRINAALGTPTRLMGGSKGAHLVVDHPALHAALNGHMVYFGTGDGRVNLVYPFMDRVLIGATDVRIDDPDGAVCDPAEADYLRGVVAEVFPDLPVTEDQVLHRFSGVRPLPRADGDVGSVTRDHAVAELELACGTPVLCLIGGKWTTFRRFSEEAADRVLAILGRDRRCRTERMAIGGGADYPAPAERARWVARCAAGTNLAESRVETLLGRYGTRAAGIAAALGAADRPLASLPAYGREELLWLIRHERVGSVDDLLARRTDIAISGAATEAVRDEVSALFDEEVRRAAAA